MNTPIQFVLRQAKIRSRKGEMRKTATIQVQMKIIARFLFYNQSKILEIKIIYKITSLIN